MYINKESATAETLKPTVEWIKKSEDERIKLIGEKLKKNELYKDFEITNAHENGDVIIKIEKTIPAKIRGVLLLEMEAMLKDFVDPGIVIWLTSIVDKSKLRNLRGIEFKTFKE